MASLSDVANFMIASNESAECRLLLAEIALSTSPEAYSEVTQACLNFLRDEVP